MLFSVVMGHHVRANPAMSTRHVCAVPRAGPRAAAAHTCHQIVYKQQQLVETAKHRLDVNCAMIIHALREERRQGRTSVGETAQ